MNMYKLISKLVMLAAALLTVGCGGKAPENSMTYRTLGNTGMMVSEVGLGCGGFEEMSNEEAKAFMDVAIDSGMNYIDLYDANPVVRDNIGYALKGRRDKMYIQGHIGTYWNNGQYMRTRDVDTARMGFEDMLQRLGTDYIEVGMMHIFDKMEDWDALEATAKPYWDYVQQLKAEGKIKHIGMSTHNAQVALAAAKSGKVEVIMFSINPAFDRVSYDKSIWDTNSYHSMLAGIDPVRVEFYDYCAQHGIGVTVMKAFGGGGRLLDAKKSPMGVAFTPVQCIAYCLAKPCIGSVLCGAGNIEELKSDLEYLHATEAEKEYNGVLAVSGSKKEGLGDCTYCSHCAPCSAGINIAKVNDLLDKALREGVTAELRAEYDALEHHASDCVKCGACETRCPFGVSIMDRMEEAQRLFGK